MPEFEEEDNKSEGYDNDAYKLAPSTQFPPDGNVVEYSTGTTDRARADFQFLNYWLTMHNFINTASLEIFGDPSPDIQPGNTIAVYLYVPDAEGKLTGIHWMSSLWSIVGVSHSIGGGSFTTNLDLVRSAFGSGVVQTTALYDMAAEDLGG